MGGAFPHLFSPLTLRHRTLRHRLNFGAHTANMSEAGLPGAQHLGYYLERARGGAAMIVVEPVPVHATAVLTRGNFRPDDDAVIPGFRRITEACRAEGAVMIQQLYHVGQHGDADNAFAPNWSPSGLPSYHDADGSHAMTEAEIEEILAAFVRAALRARESGFDGVELFAAYHALIDQFWTPWSNRRDDAWGGSFEKRMRFSTELLSGIRRAVGEDFIVGLAVNLHPEAEVSLSVEAMQEIATYHDQRGLMDYITCGTGSYFDFYKLIPVSLFDDMLGPPFAKALKQAVTYAKVQAESHIRTPANAETVIAEGMADMVSIVRGQIADPHLANKAREGRPEDIRPCISCNQLCWGRRHRDYWISCLVNPSTGREHLWGGDLPPESAAETPRHILVVGGGPAGLEAARVAAARGHRVTLVERRDRLGGQWWYAAQQPSRGKVGEHLSWYQTQLEKLQVEVRLETELDAASVAEFGADAVVLATGGRPSRRGFQRALAQQDSLPGAESGNVATIYEALEGTAELGQRVLLLDEMNNWRGLGTAVHLAEAGHEVTVITAASALAKGLEASAADVPLRQRFAKAGGRGLVETALLSWSEEGQAHFRALLDGREWKESYDSLVLCTLPEAETALPTALAESGLEVHSIGDCVAPRRAALAIYEGRKLGLSL